MASAQTIWGIDLGRCALKAMKLRVGLEGKVDVLTTDYIEHAKILSQPDADRDALIGSALEKFLSRNDISKDQIVVSVPGQHTLSRFSKLPPVSPKRIPDIVRYEADQQIPFDMDEIIWDYQTFQEEGAPDIEVGIFAMKRELIREHLLHFEQASIEPIAVQSGPLAVYNAIHYDGALGKETTVLLDIGAETTDVIIATRESIWTRTIQIGGNNFTEALVKSFKLSFSKAENLKRTATTSKYARQVFQALRPVFADLVQELQRSLGFYSSTHRDVRFEKAIAVGNAFKLPGLQKYLQQNLGMTVEKSQSFDKLEAAEGVDIEALKEEGLSFAVAYGLALQGLDVGKVATNLLPVEIAKQVVWRKKRPAFAAAAACLVLAGGLIWLRQSADMSALAAASEGVDRVRVAREDASRILDIGATGVLSDRARATQILQAGKEMRKALQELSGEGEAELTRARQLIEIQANKTMIPKILQAIHTSVPVPQGPLGAAATQREVLDAIEAGGAPRGERRRIFIDELDMHFEPDVNAYVDDWISLVDVEDPINDPESDLPGILIKIRGRTPHKDGRNFIAAAFMTALRENGRRGGEGFYFDRVYLRSAGRVTPAQGHGAAAREPTPTPSRRSGRGGMKGRLPWMRRPGSARGGPAGHVSPVVTSAAGLDPVTLEPVESDWEFEIWVDAILEDYPQQEADENVDADTEGDG